MRLRLVAKELEAKLRPGPAAPFPRATGKLERKTYRGGEQRLKITCRNVAAADGTEAMVNVGRTAVARLAINRGRGRVELETERGDAVPVFEAGQEVVVDVGGVPVLMGTLVED